MPLRQVQGFAKSLFKSNRQNLRVPDFSQLSRRAKKIKAKLHRFKRGEKMHLLVDSTGLKIYGEGEWKVRTHGAGKRRTWRKLHIAMNADNFEIVDEELTTLKTHDSHAAETFLENIKSQGEGIKSFRGDGAYDTHALYYACERQGIEPIIPPREGAILVSETYKNVDCLVGKRDRTVFDVRAIGKEKWKEMSGYHVRSLVECQMSRYKRIIGASLRSRNVANQDAEARIACSILNKMAALGMPDTIRVT